MSDTTTTTSPPAEFSARDLLRLAIDESHMSARQFATRVLLRNERTVRRWLEGASPIPREVVTWLELPTAARSVVAPEPTPGEEAE